MRITGGTHRSRPLRAPRGTATRPTSDRVREALFGILTSAGAIDGAVVLDLYAGTGALALEALSRGAASATLVESSKEAADAARHNVDTLGLAARARVVLGDVARTLARASAAHDLVFADPPWALVDDGTLARDLSTLAARGTLAPGGTLVLEHSARSGPPDLAGLERGATRRYGDTALTFYKPAILASLPPTSLPRA